MTTDITNKQIVVKSFGFDGINDDSMRKFSCWGSVEVVDRQKEIIPAEEVYKIMANKRMQSDPAKLGR